MKRMIKTVIQMMLTGIILFVFTVPGFAEVSIVPGKASVEQGLQGLTLDAEGAENFRYAGRKNGTYLYRGKLKPGSKLKFVFKAALRDEKSLSLTGRSCVVQMQVTAKKGKEVLETKKFSRENKSNIFLNYTVPKDADALAVDETFELYNESKNVKFNKKVISRNQLNLTTKDAAKGTMADLVQKAGVKIVDDSDGKENVKSITKDNSKTKPKSGKIDAGSSDMESKESNSGMFVAIAAVILLTAGAGAFFFMKKKKASKAAATETGQKEKLRRQESQRQQEIQKQQAAQKKQEMRRIYEEMEQRNKKLAEERALEQQESLKENTGAVSTAVPPAGAVPARFCSNCGAKLESDSMFCENCGTRV